MSATYGERLLEQAQRRAEKRRARRRVLTLFAPGCLAVVWAVDGLLDKRLQEMRADDAGAAAIVGGLGLLIAWHLLFVLLPLFGALKSDPLPSGAALAVVAGPVLTPLVFGVGWPLLPALLLLGVCTPVLVAMVERARAGGRPARA